MRLSQIFNKIFGIDFGALPWYERQTHFNSNRCFLKSSIEHGKRNFNHFFFCFGLIYRSRCTVNRYLSLIDVLLFIVIKYSTWQILSIVQLLQKKKKLLHPSMQYNTRCEWDVLCPTANMFSQLHVLAINYESSDCRYFLSAEMTPLLLKFITIFII